jgi:glycosyltransferase involved in cell wall biosynthesis
MSKAEGSVKAGVSRSGDLADVRRCAVAAAAPPVRVAVVCELCSLRMGGEAAIAFHYFRMLRQRGVDAHLLAHARNEQELTSAFPHDVDRLHLIGDSLLHRATWALGRLLPDEVMGWTTGLASRLYTQALQRRILRRLVRSGAVNVIHQPTPVSPAMPSLIHGCGGAAVLIGPMNGDMTYPPAFRGRAALSDRAFVHFGRWVARWANGIISGKRHASLLLAANARTEAALNSYHPDHAPVRLVENGVDLSFWGPSTETHPSPHGHPVRFMFSGRLVGWKGVDLLLAAWAKLPRDLQAELVIVGDGPARSALEEQHRKLQLGDRVRFLGWLPQTRVVRELHQSDVLVHPSLRECGGSSVLEAMACRLPVIAVEWGGPADYVDPTCGLLLPPTSPGQLVQDLTAAIVKLAESEPLRLKLGAAAREKVVALYSWDAKITRMLGFYTDALGRSPATVSAAPTPPKEIEPAEENEVVAMGSNG